MSDEEISMSHDRCGALRDLRDSGAGRRRGLDRLSQFQRVLQDHHRRGRALVLDIGRRAPVRSVRFDLHRILQRTRFPVDGGDRYRQGGRWLLMGRFRCRRDHAHYGPGRRSGNDALRRAAHGAPERQHHVPFNRYQRGLLRVDRGRRHGGGRRARARTASVGQPRGDRDPRSAHPLRYPLGGERRRDSDVRPPGIDTHILQDGHDQESL